MSGEPPGNQWKEYLLLYLIAAGTKSATSQLATVRGEPPTQSETSPNRAGVAEPHLKIWDKNHGQTDGQTDRQMDGRTDGQMDRQDQI